MRSSLVALAALLLLLMPLDAQASTCFMVYMMADNNLESYLHQSYQELSTSQLVSSPDTRTWIYYDAFNQGGAALPNTVTSRGNLATQSFVGSRYITYDPTSGYMRIDEELLGEQNSDTQDTIQNFMEHALTDCLGSGFDSLMLVFASLGGGFAGFGGDENARKLLQTNGNIANAIRLSLDSFPTGPTKVEVLGFDANSMAALGAADDFMDVADYLLASESFVPGHGWPYASLTGSSNALGVASEVASTFTTATQSGSAHATPKTIALVDLEGFSTFVAAFEAFSSDLHYLLQQGDVSLYSFVSRARDSSVAFLGIVDSVGSTNPSSLDIGSFLQEFQSLCNPGEPLQSTLQSAISAYSDMLVTQKVAPGTAPGTGMHVTWPNQGEYSTNAPLWNQVLFQNINYVTQITPNFRELLQWYLPSSPPASGTGVSSVCAESSEPTGIAGDSPLILDDYFTNNETSGLVSVTADLSPNVSQVRVEYGIDVSGPLSQILEDKGYQPQNEEYLYLLGGNVPVAYSGDEAYAAWDQQFYFLNISEWSIFEPLYVFVEGNGARRSPCFYFSNAEDVADLQFLDYMFFDFSFWVEKGGHLCSQVFSVDEQTGTIDDNLSLYVSNNQGVWTEQPTSAGGYVIPLAYVDGYVQDRRLNTLPGGFNQTVYPWDESLAYSIEAFSSEEVFATYPQYGAVVVETNAYNLGNPTNPPETRYYDIFRRLVGGTGDAASNATDPPVQDNPSAAASRLGAPSESVFP